MGHRRSIDFFFWGVMLTENFKADKEVLLVTIICACAKCNQSGGCCGGGVDRNSSYLG